jgi:dihydroxy-acid dehydratase
VTAILGKKVQSGDAVIIRYEGPKGGPGMREMQMFRALLKFGGLDNQVYLITDGRFSGYTGGACIGYLSPEAAEGGPLALIRDGDTIAIDVEARRLDVRLSDEELTRRAKTWKRPPPRVTSGYLARYAERATSAATGAIIP